MREKWNVKLSILYNKYDFVHFSSLKLGRCLVLCPGLNHYIELHLINLLNLVSLMEKDRKKCQMRQGLAESWSLYVTTCCFSPQAMQTMGRNFLCPFHPYIPSMVTHVWIVKYFSMNSFLILHISTFNFYSVNSVPKRGRMGRKNKKVSMEIIFSPAKESSSAEKISSPGMSCKNWVQTEKVKYTAYRNTFFDSFAAVTACPEPTKKPKRTQVRAAQCAPGEDAWMSIPKKEEFTQVWDCFWF